MSFHISFIARNIKKDGLFWSTKINEKDIFSKIDKVINLNFNKWNKMILKRIKRYHNL